MAIHDHSPENGSVEQIHDGQPIMKWVPIVVPLLALLLVLSVLVIELETMAAWARRVEAFSHFRWSR